MISSCFKFYSSNLIISGNLYSSSVSTSSSEIWFICSSWEIHSYFKKSISGIWGRVILISIGLIASCKIFFIYSSLISWSGVVNWKFPRLFLNSSINFCSYSNKFDCSSSFAIANWFFISAYSLFNLSIRDINSSIRFYFYYKSFS